MHPLGLWKITLDKGIGKIDGASRPSKIEGKDEEESHCRPSSNISLSFFSGRLLCKIAPVAVSGLVLDNGSIGSSRALENPCTWDDLGNSIARRNFLPAAMLFELLNLFDGHFDPFFPFRGMGHGLIKGESVKVSC